jgi:hypothetical protein
MFSEVDTKKPREVCAETIRIFRGLFPSRNSQRIEEYFDWAGDCFGGRFPGYQEIDAKYHDFEHTLQGTLCFARLLEGYKRAQAAPELQPRAFELGLVAILLHDTGYLKTDSDHEGTGAKYTLTHVARSAEFAEGLLAQKGFPSQEIHSVQNMIRCTGVNADLRSIPFQSDLERAVGSALATADLLGQMAAPDYIDKLGILYQEFEESNQFNRRAGEPNTFKSADELRTKTPVFWRKYVLSKIENDFGKLYRYLNQPFPNGPNRYLDQIESNISKLQNELDQAKAPHGK